jgi:hypothetical protein
MVVILKAHTQIFLCLLTGQTQLHQSAVLFDFLCESIRSRLLIIPAVTEFVDQSEIILICVYFLLHPPFYWDRVIGFTVYLQFFLL